MTVVRRNGLELDPDLGRGVASVLRNDERFLHVAWRHGRVVGTMIGSGGARRSADLGPADALRAVIGAFRRRLEAEASNAPRSDRRRRPGAAIDPDVGEALASLLLRPFLARVARRPARLVIAPEGASALLPWGALPWRGGPLRASVQLARTTSPEAFLARRRRAHPRRATRRPTRPVLMGDPEFGGAPGPPPGAWRSVHVPTMRADRSSFAALRLPRLPYTTEEVRIAGRLLGGAEVITGADATVAALLSVRAPRILHIATHGFVQEDTAFGDGPRSLLALAGARTVGRDEGGPLESAFVFAESVARLDLRGTELVVLSACSTSMSHRFGGAEVVSAGIVHAMLAGGAEHVVGALWRVPDRDTVEVMEAFYRGIVDGLDPCAALQRAKRTVSSSAAAAAEAFVCWL